MQSSNNNTLTRQAIDEAIGKIDWENMFLFHEDMLLLSSGEYCKVRLIDNQHYILKPLKKRKNIDELF